MNIQQTAYACLRCCPLLDHGRLCSSSWRGSSYAHIRFHKLHIRAIIINIFICYKADDFGAMFYQFLCPCLPNTFIWQKLKLKRMLLHSHVEKKTLPVRPILFLFERAQRFLVAFLQSCKATCACVFTQSSRRCWCNI